MKIVPTILFIALVLCACSSVDRARPTSIVTVEPATAATTTVTNHPTSLSTVDPVTATSTPVIDSTKAISVTSTPTFMYYRMVKTPFWLSYENGTPVPVFTEYPPYERSDYLEKDLEMGVGGAVWMFPFKTDFETAVLNDQAWIRYPEQIALRISGYPLPDYPSPEEVILFQPEGDVVIAIVTDWRLMDDSLSAKQYRVEMSRSWYYWQVDWFGSRWQCHRNRGHTDWGIELCR